MTDASQGMVAFLGVAADRRLLDEDRFNLPDAEQYRTRAVATHGHGRLVAAGSALTGITLVGGVALALYGLWAAVFNGGGMIDAVLAVIGIVLAATHWGWVHVAEYLSLTLDDRQQRASDDDGQRWLAAVEPYPRFSVSTGVLDNASTRVVRVLHQPVLTAQHTFTFVRETDAEETYDADTSAEVIASAVETMRRRARLDTDRVRDLWDTTFSAYQAALMSADDDQQRLAAQQAAATALSEHINASLLEPPLVE
jgi:hypothetical protein